MSDEPKTFPERLDAAQDGNEFAGVLEELFRAAEAVKDKS